MYKFFSVKTIVVRNICLLRLQFKQDWLFEFLCFRAFWIIVWFYSSGFSWQFKVEEVNLLHLFIFFFLFLGT